MRIWRPNFLHAASDCQSYNGEQEAAPAASVVGRRDLRDELASRAPLLRRRHSNLRPLLLFPAIPNSRDQELPDVDAPTRAGRRSESHNVFHSSRRPASRPLTTSTNSIRLRLNVELLVDCKYSYHLTHHDFIMKEEEVIYLASAGYDHTIRFWSPHEGKCTRVIQHPHSQVNDLKITPDKTYLAAAGFQHVRMYNILTVHNNNPEINLEGFNNNVLSIGFQEDSKWLFSGGEDCVTRVWDLRTRKNQSQRMYETESAVNSVKLHTNQIELFIGQQYGHINIWDLRFTNGNPMVRLTQQHPSNYTGVQCLSLNPIEDMMAAIDNVGHVHVFSPAQSLRLFRSWKAHSRYGIKCLFSPNGRYLVTTSADSTAKVWRTCDILKYNPEDERKKQEQEQQEDIQEGPEPIATISGPSESSATAPTAVTAATAATTISSSSSATPSSPSSPTAPSLSPFKVLSCENRWVWDVAFSADSQFLITASSDSVVRLWHVGTAETRREYTGHQKAVTALAFSD